MADSLQILIADDHALFRKGFAMLLQDSLADSKVIEAYGFDAALDILASNADINAAFFDLMMPGMAGAESIRAVREAYPELRVAVVTGLENRALALQVIDAGANGYILKSASEEEMIRAVNRLLTGETYLPSVLPQIPDTKTAWTMPHIGLKAEKIADLPLTQRSAQLVIAREYGYAGWQDLIAEVSKRLGKGLEWAAAQARRVIHDNDVERLKQLLAEHPALLSWQGDDAGSGLVGFATGSYGDSFDPVSEQHFTRAACAELLIDAGVSIAVLEPMCDAQLPEAEHILKSTYNDWLADVWLGDNNWHGRWRGAISG